MTYLAQGTGLTCALSIGGNMRRIRITHDKLNKKAFWGKEGKVVRYEGPLVIVKLDGDQREYSLFRSQVQFL